MKMCNYSKNNIALKGLFHYFEQHEIKIVRIGELIHKYLPSVKTIDSFARITDVTPKTHEELSKLRAQGYDGLTIGIETGDDKALRFMNKGYTSADIIEQCQRLDAAGVHYSFFYLVSISGSSGKMSFFVVFILQVAVIRFLCEETAWLRAVFLRIFAECWSCFTSFRFSVQDRIAKFEDQDNSFFGVIFFLLSYLL